MWEVRVGTEVIESFKDRQKALDMIRELRDEGIYGAEVHGTGTLAEEPDIQIDKLPLSMRK